MLRLFLAALLLWTSAANAESIKVVASFSIIGDITRVIGDNDIMLTTLVGPGSDVHVYQPGPTDAIALARANLIIVNGLGLEGWMTRLITAAGSNGKIITASDGVTPLPHDPHAWQNLANGKIYAKNIAAALAAADPANATSYKARADAYINELTTLEAWVKSEIKTVPPSKRKVITTHDAFGYFAGAYGVEFIAPIGISTESDVSAAGLAHLIDQIRAQHIRALFLENITDDRIIRQLEKDGNATIGGTLYSDALSPPNGPADHYTTMFRHNVTQLVAGMQTN